MSEEPVNFSSALGIPEQEFRLVLGRTKIDYDPNKNIRNIEKHTYSLEYAVRLLERLLLPIGVPRPYARCNSFLEKGEVRHQHMFVDDNGHVVLMVTTMRDDETVRVISLRRASEAEREMFRGLTGYAKSNTD